MKALAELRPKTTHSFLFVRLEVVKRNQRMNSMTIGEYFLFLLLLSNIDVFQNVRLFVMLYITFLLLFPFVFTY